VRPRPLDPDEPERIGDYRLINVLGEGGQGVVYLGEASSGTRVAIKLLHVRAAMDSESRRRFLREADTARRVAPFCTTRVLDVGAFHDRPFVVSEYVPGASLADAVATDGPRTGSGLQRLAVTTLTALAAIHRAGVVHRDFKPSNVILGPEGPVVIDFGIARVVDHSTAGSGLVGTPAYIAPEQLIGHPPGPASDMFSWACTMAFAATGRLAFTGTTIPALLLAVSTHDPDLSGVPGELRPLLAACLDKNPDARPTAAALLYSLTGDDRQETDRVRTTLADTRAIDDTSPPVPSPAGPAPAVSESTTSVQRETAVPLTASSGQETAQGQQTTQSPVADRGGRQRSWTRRWYPGLVAGLTGLLVTGVIVVLRYGTSQSPPQVAPSGTLLYEDDFSNRGNWDGYRFNPDATGDNRTTHGYEIDRGVYSIRADTTSPSNPALSPLPVKDPTPPSAVERNVMINVTAQVQEGSTGQGAFGVLCRWDEDVPNGYAFLLGLDGAVHVVRKLQGSDLDVVPSVRVGAPSAGQKVRIQAACRSAGSGTRLTMWIDGTQALDVTDPQTLPDGPTAQVGLMAKVPESGGGVFTVSFDDFSVYRTP
jgi:serine/threonine protein kinase